MRRVILNTVAVAGALAMLLVSGLAARPDDRADLMKAREAVWRAWFVNDAKALEAMVPPDTIVIGSGQEVEESGGHPSIGGQVPGLGRKADPPGVSADRNSALRRCRHFL